MCTCVYVYVCLFMCMRVYVCVDHEQTVVLKTWFFFNGYWIGSVFLLCKVDPRIHLRSEGHQMTEYTVYAPTK